MKLISLLTAGILCLFAGTANAICPHACSKNGSARTINALAISGQTAIQLGPVPIVPVERVPGEQHGLPRSLPNNKPAHPRVECSNKGICNKATGECHCFENYDGKACERTSCPNDCSGRGVCLDQKALAEAEGAAYELPWDGEKAMGCKCDPGYRGPDCSQKECPSGADVLGGEGAAEGRDCSGRGNCNYTSGLHVLRELPLMSGEETLERQGQCDMSLNPLVGPLWRRGG
ncbi:hypothetical protein THAOC_33530 [Thalassiosira oceanica]|uniref:EGF-like domain-containing protein n=1 Tax=Thalassiosira oceanica TaxID=159749 RepID=K0R418_THAOC|nr:hypothetical protein THAOC_33530 [Thalassiosira oceanica]|eukprot:EJK47733.1 hypothetical protein THAOC_33530 [Thalassiosira oceanica]